MYYYVHFMCIAAGRQLSYLFCATLFASSCRKIGFKKRLPILATFLHTLDLIQFANGLSALLTFSIAHNNAA